MSDDEQLIDASSITEEEPKKEDRKTKQAVEEEDGLDEDTADFGCLGSSAACNPFKKVHRFLVLPLVCLLSFGSYYCYDNPAALAPQFKNDLGLVGGDFMLLYSLYSWPNVFLCFIGGYLIDRVFGVRLGALIFGLMVTVGQVIFAAGGYLNNRYVMYAGRFVFGLGGENLSVAANTYIVSWFAGKEINTVFGINLSFSRIGSTVGMVSLAPFYNAIAPHFKDNKAHLMGCLLLFGALLCIFSLLCAMLLAALDKRASRILKKNASGTGEVIKLSDITRFSTGTWLIFMVCVTYYVSIFPFVSLGKLFYEQKFGLTQEQAGVCNSLIYFVGAGASPIAGLMIDYSGRNISWLLAAIAITLGAFGLLAFTFLHPYVPAVLMAISYSMCASSLWPMVSLVVPEYQLGTAYGMMQSIQNLGLAVVGYAAGIVSAKNGYFMLSLMFMCWLALSAVSIVLLWAWDSGQGGYLNASPSRRKEMDEDEVQAALGEDGRQKALISDSSVLDISTSFRASTARHLREKYRNSIDRSSHAQSSQSAEIHRSYTESSINLGRSYNFTSIANPTILK